MKIKDLELNQLETITLAVKSATARETRAKKPYLFLEFYDGTDTICGNYWDWAGANIPPKNAILDVKAQVAEWKGAKQLNIKGMSTNKTMQLSDFAPTSTLDVGKIYKDAYALMSSVTDEFLRSLAMSLLEEMMEAWLTVPGAKGIHHAYKGGTLIHSYSVACIAKAMAMQIPGANVDLCTVGGMLHDIGKLYTYSLDGVTIDMTDEGMLYDHLFMGAEFIGNYADSHYNLTEESSAKIEMLRHILLSHHGRHEYGAVVNPLSIEAHIVYHADAVDVEAEEVRESSAKVGNVKWTERIWALENRPHLTTQYVRGLMKHPSAE